jgi:hypothetical protein
MKRLPALLLAIVTVGCCLPSERESLKPLPEEPKFFTYQEILNRARLQASAALEAFYIDSWMDLEQAAKVLEQTARFLPRTTEQPDHLKKVLVAESDHLREEAVRLGEAARGKNVQAANTSLQTIHLVIRTLRPKDETEK